MKNLTYFLSLVVVFSFFSINNFAQQPIVRGLDVWTRTGPVDVNSPTGAYSYINDRSILAYGNNVWAGSNGDGFYKSTDGGKTWKSSSKGLPRDSQNKIATDAEHLVGSFNPARAAHLYIGTADVNNLYRSADGGDNWSKVFRTGVPYVDSTTTSLFVANVPVGGGAELPDQLWVSVYGYSSGIYYSLNDGKDWAPFDAQGLPTTNCQVVSGKEGAPTGDPDLVLAACRSTRTGVGSVYKSLAHNPRWTSSNNGLPGNLDVSVISPSNKDGMRRLYLGLSNYFSNGAVRIYRTDDNGESWNAASNGLPPDADVRDIVVDVRRSDVAYAALRGNTGGVYKTIDAGRNWFLFSNGLNTSTAAGLALGIATSLSTAPAMVHLGTYKGVWSITDTNSANCNVSLSDPARSVPSWQDNYAVNVTANSGCNWSAAASDPSWIKLGAITSGTGSATISFTILENASVTSRLGTISIGGSILTINQSGRTTCEYYLPFATQFLSPGAGSGLQFYLRTTSNDCPWAASSTAAWIRVTPPASGNGSSYINYSVLANPDSHPRTGTINVGGRSLTVTQYDASSDPCVQKLPIVIGQIINGSFSTSDCHQNDFYRDRYSFRAIAGQRIFVEMSAPSVFPALNLWLASNNPLPGPAYGSEHSIRFPIGSGYLTLSDSGEYIIEAKDVNGGIGDYTIKVVDAESMCPPVPIAPGTYAGSLSISDCGNGLGQSSDIYTFYGTQGQQITVSAGSPAVDIFLILYNDAKVVAMDDNGGGGTTARIPAAAGKLTLPATGLYRIEVTTRSNPPKFGDYNLVFTSTARAREKKTLRNRASRP